MVHLFSNKGAHMTTFPRLTLGLAAAGLAVTGLTLAPQLGSAAPAKATTHTLRLKAHETATHNIPPNHFIGADTDRSPATGKIRGYDSITGSFNFTTHKVKIDAAVALKGGLITAHLAGSGKILDGAITGGTGKYKTIQGKIHTVDKGHHVTIITLTYTL